MTIREGAILSAYTGVMLCQTYPPVFAYLEEIMGRPVTKSEFRKLRNEIRENSREDFIKIVSEQEG